MRRCAVAILLAILAISPCVRSAEKTQEERAVAHLVREVPAWARENGCYSCHNNGDGARALLIAAADGFAVPDDALAGTLRWLRKPSTWNDGAKHPMASDTKLARIQFAVTLGTARRLGVEPSVEIALENAALLASAQSDDGAWHVETGDMVGSPITWGTTLATTLAVAVLEDAHDSRFAASIDRARSWLRKKEPESNLDRAALLLAFPRDKEIGRNTLPALLAAQTSDGGWGPQPGTPAEPFDTAVALLALKGRATGASPGNRELLRHPIERGRAFLLQRQLENGGWPETTRPQGNSSYAHHVSTSAWAAIALLSTNPKRH